MYEWRVSYWKEIDDCATDVDMIVEARNAEEACDIASFQDKCGKHFKAVRNDSPCRS